MKNEIEAGENRQKGEQTLTHTIHLASVTVTAAAATFGTVKKQREKWQKRSDASGDI